MLLGRLGLPESARWLWSKGRKDEALVIAHKYLRGESELADLDEVVAAIRARLALFHLWVRRMDGNQSVLVLTLEAADLWSAVLLTMNAVTATGHDPTAVHTVPAVDVGGGR